MGANQNKKISVFGGQFEPDFTGQFGPDLGGQFNSDFGGQYDWFFQSRGLLRHINKVFLRCLQTGITLLKKSWRLFTTWKMLPI